LADLPSFRRARPLKRKNRYIRHTLPDREERIVEM
jgi:hypothetical protein